MHQHLDSTFCDALDEQLFRVCQFVRHRRAEVQLDVISESVEKHMMCRALSEMGVV